MKRLLATLLGTTLLWTPALVAQVEGEPPYAACKPGGFTVVGYPDEFGPQRGRTFPVVIDSKFQGQFLTTQRIWLPAILDAIDKWNAVAGAQWHFDNQGLTTQEPMGIDGRVTIASCGFEFGCKETVPVPPQAPPDPMLPPEVVPQGQFTARQLTLAVTLISADFSREKGILDADIYFNPEAPFQTDPNQGQIDFESVLLHELGHVVGLGHNDNCGGVSTIMESVIDVGERKRDLQGPETEGLKFLYPDDSSPSVRIYPYQSSLRFDAIAGELPPFAQSISLYGARGTNWKAAVTTSTGGNWIVLDPPTGNFATDGAVEVAVDSTGLAPGNYTATINFNADGRTGPAASVSVALAVTEALDGSQAPLITSVVSAADPNQTESAPGALISIYGLRLATTTASATGSPLPTNLAGTEVIVNSKKAPLLYVSPTQINAQYPVDAEYGRGGVIVRTGLGQSLTTFMDSTEAAPQLFTHDGQVVALNQDGSVNSAENAAGADSVVSVFLTGQGPVDPPVASGQAGGANPTSEVILPAKAQIGGSDVEILYLGLSPGFAGLSQANLRVPTGLSGNLPVRITIGERVSNTGLLAVD